MFTRVLTLSLLAWSAGCYDDGQGPAIAVRAEAWQEADALFRGDPGWLGAARAVSVDLGQDRTLWLFGWSLIDPSGNGERTAALRVPNSIALQDGRNPVTAEIRFFWKTEGGLPASFFPEQGAEWSRPLHGVRTGGVLTLFMARHRDILEEAVGSVAIRVENPDDDPSAWRTRRLALPVVPFTRVIGVSVLARGGHVYAYANGRSGNSSAYALRWPESSFQAGVLTDPEWWSGSARGWVGGGSVPGTPAPVLSEPASHFSVLQDSSRGRLVIVQSKGWNGDFHATELGLRTAPAPQGPFPKSTTVFHPPETQQADVFSLSGRGHPQLAGADLVATYVPTSFVQQVVVNGNTLDYPHFVRLTFTD